MLVNIWEGVDPVAEARRFAELWAIEGTVLVDAGGEVAERLGVRGVPTNVFVDADGTVVDVGAVTPAELEAATHRLLGPDADIDPPAESSGWHWGQDPAHIEKLITVHNDAPAAPPGREGG